MASYYSQVEDAIRKNEQELSHLRDELRGLQAVENVTPRENYQRQYGQILYHMEQEQRRLEENQRLLNNYNSATTNISELRNLRDQRFEESTEELDKLRALLSTERDPQIRREISEELDAKTQEYEARRAAYEQEHTEQIEAKERAIVESMSILTDELAEEVRNSFLNEKSPVQEQSAHDMPEVIPIEEPTTEELTPPTAEENKPIVQEEPQLLESNEDERENKLQTTWEAANAEYIEAEKTYQASIAEFQRIFTEERTRMNEDGPFATEEELDAFTANYMRQKIEQNVRFEEARRRMADASKSMEAAEKQMQEYGEAKEKAASLKISVEEYQNMKEIVQRKDVLSAVYKQKGLGDVSRRSKKGREQVSLVTDEIIQKIVERFKEENKTLNPETTRNEIINAINLLYGTDIKVRQQQKPRTTKMTPAATEQVRKKSGTGVRKVKGSGEHKEVNPGPAPIGVPVQQQKGLPSGERRLGLPPGELRLALTAGSQDNTQSPEVKPEKTKVEQPTNPPIEQPKRDPQPKKEPQPKMQPEKKEEPRKPKRGLLTIMDELTDGLRLAKKDGNRYKASNIKVADSFRQELQSGNYLYNIVHLVPAVVKLPFKLLQKAAGKIMLSAEAKATTKELKSRLEKLSEEDLMTIYKEYRGNRVKQERFPTILNTLIDERIQQYALSKVSTINAELEQRYKNAFGAIKQLEAIDATLRNPNTSDAQKASYKEYRAKLLEGQAKNIVAIRNGYTEANGWLSGGAHGFSEDMKAAATKLSVVGKRFAKDHDLDHELLHKQAQLERAEMHAIANGDDEMALRTFVQAEALLSKNTEISASLFGKRSTGKKYYSPLAEQLDYRDDPFVRDIFTTVAVTSAVIGSVNAAETQTANDTLIAEQQAAIKRNEEIMRQVNVTGADIAGKRDVILEGIQSQSIQSTLTASGEIERGVLDSTNWSLGTNAYRTADSAGHAFYNEFHASTQAAIEDVATQYASGAITQQQAMQLMSDISNNAQATLGNVTEECLKILNDYAPNNPQFDLTGVQEAMEYLVANPNAISEMNKAMVDITAAGEALAELQFEQVAAIQSLPNDVQSQLLAYAGTAALALNVATTMQENAKYGKYGNAVTIEVEQYNARQAEAENASKGARR